MPNYLNHSAPQELAQIYGRRVKSPEARQWFATTVARWLGQQPDCALAVRHVQPDFPDWAIRALRQGQPVHHFRVTQDTNTRLKTVLRWIRSLEETTRQDSETSALQSEADRQLRGLARCGFDQALHNAQRWFTAQERQHHHQNRQQIRFEPRREPGREGRIWRRITNLGELHALGNALNNCLRDNYLDGGGYWDEEFIAADMEFWGLYTPSGRALAALRIANGIAEEFRAAHNRTAKSWQADFLKLNTRLQLKTADQEFLPLGIAEGQALTTFAACTIDRHTTVYQLPQRRLFHHPRHGWQSLPLSSNGNARHPDLLANANDSASRAARAWIGRSLATLKNRSRRPDRYGLFAEVIATPEGYRYWRDAILRQWRHQHTVYLLTPAGVARDGPIPDWVLCDASADGWLLAPGADDWLTTLEQGDAPLRFWRKLDPEAQRTSCLACLDADTEGRPTPYSAPTPAGWQGSHQGWRTACYKDGSKVPPQQCASGAIAIIEREVLDLRLRQSRGVCWFKSSAGAGPRLPYAFQLIARVADTLEAGGLLHVTSAQDHEFTLTAPGRHPAALAHLLNVVWAPDHFTLHIPPEWTARFSRLVTETDEGYRPLLPAHRIPELGGWAARQQTVIGYDMDDRVLWSAWIQDMELSRPEFWTLPQRAAPHAIGLAAHFGFRLGPDWREALMAQHYYLDDGYAFRLPAATLNTLTLGNAETGAQFERHPGQRFHWTLRTAEGIIAELDDPEGNHCCTLTLFRTLGHPFPTQLRLLIHALLDYCGKTLYPLDLYWIGLQRLPTGHTRVPPPDTLSVTGLQATWQRRARSWVLMRAGQMLGELKGQALHLQPGMDAQLLNGLARATPAFLEAPDQPLPASRPLRLWRRAFPQIRVNDPVDFEKSA